MGEINLWEWDYLLLDRVHLKDAQKNSYFNMFSDGKK